MNTHTPGPWYVGAQNDMLYITAGEKPALNNDYPRHDANRTVIAKVYSERDAKSIAAVPDLIDALRDLKALVRDGYQHDDIAMTRSLRQAQIAIDKATR